MSDTINIKVTRVLCISFMMFVHVPAADLARDASAVGRAGVVIIYAFDVLGRASVPALSFLSGFLLASTAAALTTAAVASQRARTLLVPMVFWNLAFALLATANYLLLGRDERPVLLDSDLLALLTALTGIDGAPALGPTAFLRDLFLALLLVHLLLPVIRRAPIVSLGAAALLAALEVTAPVILRPAILFMVVAGAVIALRAWTLRAFTRPALFALAIPCVVAVEWAYPGGTGNFDRPEAANLLLRSGLVVVFVCTSVWLASSALGDRLARLEPHMFLTFLMHVPVMILSGLLWEALTGDLLGPGYVAFYLLVPLVALAVCQLTGRLVDTLPRPLQVVIRGKPHPARDLPTPPPTRRRTDPSR